MGLTCRKYDRDRKDATVIRSCSFNLFFLSIVTQPVSSICQDNIILTDSYIQAQIRNRD